VGATTYEDRRASYSNWGACLDLFAPGSQVLSTHHLSNTALHVENGTSMASPHVAGVVATYLQTHKAATPAEVTSAVLGAATVGKVKDPAGSPNRLLFSKIGPTSSSPPPPTSTNLVKQPGFESGLGIWKGTEWSVDCNADGPVARTGPCLAWLGGYADGRATNIKQSGIQIPPASSKKLSFYVHVQSNEITAGAFDKLAVRIVANGTTTTVLNLNDNDEGPGYVRYAFPLAAYAGQTIEVRFINSGDASAATSFFVDDVAVK
jgi:serine protease